MFLCLSSTNRLWSELYGLCRRERLLDSIDIDNDDIISVPLTPKLSPTVPEARGSDGHRPRLIRVVVALTFRVRICLRIHYDGVVVRVILRPVPIATLGGHMTGWDVSLMWGL